MTLEMKMSKRAFHYVAKIKGETPTRFYVDRESPAMGAAHAFAGWARAEEVVLWPTENHGIYRVEWFDKYADKFRETKLIIVEEYERG